MNVIQWIVSERVLELIRVPKKKPPEINDSRGFVVAGVVLFKRLK